MVPWPGNGWTYILHGTQIPKTLVFIHVVAIGRGFGEKIFGNLSPKHSVDMALPRS